MRDGLGREIDYMRISVTDRCNLRCIYCMPEEGVPSLRHDQILRFSEIVRICRAAAELGIRRLKITGGEPLVRKGIPSLIRELKALPGIEQVTLTTNGLLLEEQLEDLIGAGLDAVTVSLDTLEEGRFREITRRDGLDAVLGGLRSVLTGGKIPVKVNCVPLRGTAPEDFRRLAALARENPLHVRFIEMMPIGLGAGFPCITEAEMREILREETGELHPYGGSLGNGPARYYTAEGFRGKIGFISAVSHAFCEGCNRIRLTSDGYVKSCLQYDTGEDLRAVLNDPDDGPLREALERAILRKPAHHGFGRERKPDGAERKGMSQIGG